MAKRFNVASHTITLAEVDRILSHVNDSTDSLIAEIMSTSQNVMHEITIFNDARMGDNVLHAQQCLIFAICSPQCKFDKNVRAANRMVVSLAKDFDSIDSVYQTLTANGTDSWVTAGMSARAIFASLNFLRNVTDDDMSKSVLRAMRKVGQVKGLGEKTMAMALALYDANNPVFTLDVHMLRGLQSLSHGIIAGSMTINDNAYRALEDGMVAWHNVNMANYPIFLSQWALWNSFGFDGKHVSHLGILGA